MVIDRLTLPEQVNTVAQERLADCWIAVTNAGGAVGFPFPPVAASEVRAAVATLVEELAPKCCVLFRATEGAAVLGWVVLRRTDSPLVGHWGVVERLQTHPARRGRGIGGALLGDVERYARDALGLEQLHLAARGGMGLERYYERLGWQEIGRWPRALRLADDDRRDEVLMLRQL